MTVKSRLKFLTGVQVYECGKHHFMAEPSTLTLIPDCPQEGQVECCHEALRRAAGEAESRRELYDCREY